MIATDDDERFLHLQDVLGQILMLRTYTHITLCFPTTDEPKISEILASLRDGLVRLAISFPWLAGQVVIRGKTDSNTGLARIIPSESDIPLIVKDWRDDLEVPSMAVLRQANFPFKLLDRTKFADLPAIGESIDDTNPDPVRVLVLQANLIQGGILLNFAGAHHTMDMNGLGQIISLLSKACRREPFTTKEVEQGNRSRHNVIPLFDNDFQFGPEFDHFIAKEPEGAVAHEATGHPVEAPPPISWVYFNFDAQSLKRLKTKAATQTIADYITTNDALTALVWQHMTKARARRFPDASLGISRMMRAVDGRSVFDVDKEYLGHMVTGEIFIESDVYEKPFDLLTGQIRLGMEKSRLKYMTQGLATLLNRAPDKNKVSYMPSIDLTRDAMVSSWAKIPSYYCDFGNSLGKPESVRRARFAPVPGLVYFMPTSREGDIAVALCLHDDDIESLRNDDGFMNYATYVG